MAAKFLGAHMPTGKGLGQAVIVGHEMGCTAIQVFTKSPQLWKSKPVDPIAAQAFKEAVAKTGLSEIICHDSYLINLCAATDELREKSINGLIEEVQRCALYGIRWVNSHMGAHVGQGEEVGIAKIIEATNQVLAETPTEVGILMETTAGQGSSLGATFEQLAKVYEGIGQKERVGVCLDTCHVFAAGYDLSTEEGYEDTWARFNAVLGLSLLKAMHLNDSIGAFGSRKDRHAPIGEGEIGVGAFRRLMNDPRFENVPMVIETPMEDNGHAKDLGKLKSYFD